ncbi:aKG-HExxH-type peptide beta-hydroxylase [Actinoplanes sp. URMC 104]|uniref:aKG-HExxH-type peptide beta-hydroxylase n=1 Tax=Actinoplanes sp. URMC 104 TaxID=3423409 RepID=UPI003F1BFA64
MSSDGLVRDLGTGCGTPASLASLAAGQVRRRSARLRALIEADGGHHHRSGLPEAARHVTDEMLAYPTVGVWLAHCTDRLTQPPASVPLWADLGYLGWLVAAQHILTGRDGTFDVVLRDGAVMLPGLGLARLAGPGVHGTATLTVSSGRVELTTRGAGLVLRDLGTETDARWLPLRRLGATYSSLRTVHLDDVDPFRGRSGAEAPRLTAARAAAWSRAFLGALEILRRRHPGYSAAVDQMLRSVVPSSGRSFHAYGSVALPPPAGPQDFALALIRECQHAKFDALTDEVDLYTSPDTPTWYAPWRDDPASFPDLLRETYAHLATTDFWRTQPAAPPSPGAPPLPRALPPPASSPPRALTPPTGSSAPPYPPGSPFPPISTPPPDSPSPPGSSLAAGPAPPPGSPSSPGSSLAAGAAPPPGSPSSPTVGSAPPRDSVSPSGFPLPATSTPSPGPPTPLGSPPPAGSAARPGSAPPPGPTALPGSVAASGTSPEPGESPMSDPTASRSALLLAVGSPDVDPAALARAEFAQWRTMLRQALSVADASPLLTPAGTAFVEAMGTTVAGWSGESVPAAFEAYAREASAGHLVAWRVRNMTADVRELHERRQAGRDPGPLPESHVTGSATAVAGTRLPAGQLKLLRAAGRPLGAVPEADLAYLDGDYERALTLYSAELRDSPGSPESWAGVALSLRHLGEEESVAALFRRPELVAALHRTPADDIVSLTAWLSLPLVHGAG